MWKIVSICMLLCVGCSDDLPSFSINPDPDLPNLKLIVVKEGVGVVEADYGIDYANIDFDLTLNMSRSDAEDFLGDPVDSTTTNYTYKKDDIRYTLQYYSQSNRVSIIEVYGDRLASLYVAISNSVTSGQTKSDIERVYGKPDYDGLTGVDYDDRGLGFLFDLISQKIIGMTVRPPLLEFVGGEGTRHITLSMSKSELEAKLGDPLNVDGSIYSYAMGAFLYIVAYSGEEKVNEFIVTYFTDFPYTVLYIKHNGKEVYCGDSYEQMVSIMGTPDEQSGSFYYYYDEGVGFYFDNNEVAGYYCLKKRGRMVHPLLSQLPIER